MTIQPALGNVGSSTELVLQSDENPAGSRKRRFMLVPQINESPAGSRERDSSTKFVKIQLAQGVVHLSTKLVLQTNENPAGQY